MTLVTSALTSQQVNGSGGPCVHGPTYQPHTEADAWVPWSAQKEKEKGEKVDSGFWAAMEWAGSSAQLSLAPLRGSAQEDQLGLWLCRPAQTSV